MKYLLIMISTVILASCGATVSYDYDTKTDFSRYKTYDFYPNISSGLSNLDNIRIMKATDSLLQSRGFEKSESPQFLINFFVKEFVSNSGTTIGIGVGGGGHNGSVGVSGGIPVGGDIINQKLTFDFIDEKEDQLFWQAVGSDELKVKSSPSQKNDYYFKLVSKIFKGFPPKK